MSIFPEKWQGRLIPTHNIPKYYTKNGITYETKTNKKLKQNKMTGEQFRAIEIVLKMQFQKERLTFYQAKECALISIDEIITFLKMQMGFYDEEAMKYHLKIREEIEKLQQPQCWQISCSKLEYNGSRLCDGGVSRHKCSTHN
jgi:hypothetical protein